MIEPIDDHRLALRYDRPLSIATGRTRFDTNWKNKNMKWSALAARLREPVRTTETYDEYVGMKKADQDRIKDVGGFVGGVLAGGRRGKDSIKSRSILTLDIDFGEPGLVDVIEGLFDFGCCIYSTHKHKPDKPRLRLLVPLDRDVSPEEYEAIARKVADEIGIDQFDDSTYQPSRLMYWPSCPSNGVYLFRVFDRPFLKAEEILAQYDDWTDVSQWPYSDRVAETRKTVVGKQQDPCEKTGPIGAFCRTYGIHEVIAKFLPDVYARCDSPQRYTYIPGSTSAGVVVYENKFAYSNHSTDPACGILCNAFDLVRIHKFGHEDDEIDVGTRTTELPSYRRMIDFVNADVETKRTRAKERKAEAEEDFKDDAFENDEWVSKLEYGKNGLRVSLKNLELILRGDPELRGIVYNQMSDSMEVKGGVPWRTNSGMWRDADDAQLEIYVAKNYVEFPKTKLLTTLAKVVDDRAYHPVREYLDSLPEWDGVERVDALLIDYLGAEDSEYTRAVTRKTLCAAVSRVMHPGCKFDTMLVLCGTTGIGKSTLVARLGGEWFSDNLSLSETKDKTAAEKIQGNWIVEIGELAGIRKADIETLKGFISRQDDKYRVAYGRRVTSHKRECVFIGTTNAETGYLRDITGNRRFWHVKVTGGKKNAWQITDDEVMQIWAEALAKYKAGEPLVLGEKLIRQAEEKQREAMEHDDREGLVREYLDMYLPENWKEMSVYERRQYIDNEYNEQENNSGVYERTEVCYMEIWCEVFGKEKSNYEIKKGYEIAAILKSIGGWERAEVPKRVPPYGLQRYYKKAVTNALQV